MSNCQDCGRGRHRASMRSAGKAVTIFEDRRDGRRPFGSRMPRRSRRAPVRDPAMSTTLGASAAVIHKPLTLPNRLSQYTLA
jgi:hypothetical protein